MTGQIAMAVDRTVVIAFEIGGKGLAFDQARTINLCTVTQINDTKDRQFFLLLRQY